MSETQLERVVRLALKCGRQGSEIKRLRALLEHYGHDPDQPPPGEQP